VVAQILERLRYKLERATTNAGLARITNRPKELPKTEMATR